MRKKFGNIVFQGEEENDFICELFFMIKLIFYYFILEMLEFFQRERNLFKEVFRIGKVIVFIDFFSKNKKV